MAEPVRACYIVDDFPACPIYQTRQWGQAFGFEIPDRQYSRGWELMTKMPVYPVADTEWFADFVEEFGIRGKFTVLGYPAGRGRLDESVRGYSDEELKRLLDIVRDRIAPRFDITPEVLTHTMACDPDTLQMRPHCESHWLSHLAAEGRVDELTAYIHKAYTILRNVGLRAHGITIGGMPDLSGIAGDKPLTRGHHRDVLAEALARVERELGLSGEMTFMFTGSPAITDAGRRLRAPELIHTTGDGVKAYDVHAITDPVWFLMHGIGDIDALIDRFISRDLSHGELVDDA